MKFAATYTDDDGLCVIYKVIKTMTDNRYKFARRTKIVTDDLITYGDWEVIPDIHFFDGERFCWGKDADFPGQWLEDFPGYWMTEEQSEEQRKIKKAFVKIRW